VAVQISGHLHSLVKATRKSEEEVMALAVRAGLRELWRELVLSRFLRHEISRSDAIDAVGIDWVELAERQRDAMLEDIAWASQA